MGAAKFTRRATARDLLNISDAARERIEVERRRLQKASAVLACLIYAVNHDEPGIDPGDVASVTRELIDRAVLALDIVVLQRR